MMNVLIIKLKLQSIFGVCRNPKSLIRQHKTLLIKLIRTRLFKIILNLPYHVNAGVSMTLIRF